MGPVLVVVLVLVEEVWKRIQFADFFSQVREERS